MRPALAAMGASSATVRRISAAVALGWTWACSRLRQTVCGIVVLRTASTALEQTPRLRTRTTALSASRWSWRGTPRWSPNTPRGLSREKTMSRKTACCGAPADG